MNKIELLAPAGDLEKLKWAIMYGADAVYLGGKKFSLRANATNFTIDEIKEGVKFAHEHNAKVYVTVNILFHEEDMTGLLEYLKELEDAKVDAIIVSDLFIIDLVKENNINLEILARESSKKDIKNIMDETNMDIEVFVHGAMCTCYSGRCMLSNYMTNRDSNRGGCAQVCRWVFDLYDEYKTKISGDTEFAISPKDLSLLKYIPDLIDIGVTSLKIEGRMKSIYYIATLVSVYRRVIDKYLEDKENYKYNKKDEIELYRCANRETLPQYFDKFPGVNEQYYIGREENTNQDFLGVVLDYDEENKEIIIEQRNYFSKGDVINIFGPKKEPFNIVVSYIKNSDNELVDAARHPKEILRMTKHLNCSIICSCKNL